MGALLRFLRCALPEARTGQSGGATGSAVACRGSRRLPSYAVEDVLVISKHWDCKRGVMCRKQKSPACAATRRKERKGTKGTAKEGKEIEHWQDCEWPGPSQFTDKVLWALNSQP